MMMKMEDFDMEKEFKGTKGEWYHEFTSLSQYSPNGHSTIKAGIAGTPVAILPMPIGGINTKERNISNAQLIATAPELLEALQNIIIAFTASLEAEGYDENEEIINARKVINKALGKVE